MSAPTKVILDAKMNKIAGAVAASMALVGIGLLVMAYLRDWGFLAWFWSGVLAFGAGAGVVGALKGGGFAKAPCPECGEALSFSNPADPRTVQCEACKAWSAGIKTMALIAPDHIAPEAVFKVPFPTEGVQWPRTDEGVVACPLCSRPATREVEVQDVSGLVAGMVLPVSVQTTHSLNAPACADHENGVELFAAGDDVELGFRSYSYMHRFVETQAQA